MGFCAFRKLFKWWGFLRPFSVMLIVVVMVGVLLMVQTKMKNFIHKNGVFVQFDVQEEVGMKNLKPMKVKNRSNKGELLSTSVSPYHDWDLFAADYEEMMKTLKIFVYPDAIMSNKFSTFSSIFLPHANPFDPKLGNYFSEHMFKIALLGSSFVTKKPEEAHFYFMPFSINVMRNHPRVHSASAIEDFVAGYTDRVSSEYSFWNASGGADHFYVYCHSIGRDAASKHQKLHHNSIQVTCSSSYFQRLYIAHKDIGLPQVWPRQHEQVLNPPDARFDGIFTKLCCNFYS